MNRLHHLKITLPQNIADNSEYKNLQFVVLDYNSTDGLGEWIKSCMHDYLNSGRLIYYRTNEPNIFKRGHAANLLFKLGPGELLCKIDADNFTGKNFAFYINQQFNLKNNIFLTTIDFKNVLGNKLPPSDTFGRVCCTKRLFLKIKGYSEEMVGHGFEDYDFTNRLELAGQIRVIIDDPAFLKAITHEDTQRMVNECTARNLKAIYVSHLTPSESVILFLFIDYTFEKGTITDNCLVDSTNYYYAFRPRSYDYQYTLKESKWEKGSWNMTDATTARLVYPNGIEETITIENSNELSINCKYKSFFQLKEKNFIEQLIIFNTNLTNRNLMLSNLNNRLKIVNRKEFGKGMIFKNFDSGSSDII